MANYPNNGGRNVAIPDENRQSWRPQDEDHPGQRYRASNEDDHDYRGWRERNFDDRMERDPQRWEGSRGSELGYWEDRGMGTERYGQGQSGYSAGRYGEDRSQQMHNRNEMRPSSGAFEERGHDLGTDDRFSGRGWSAWSDRNERSYDRYDRGRFVGQDSYNRNADQRGYDQRSYERGYQGGQNFAMGRNYDRGSERDLGQAGYGRERGFSQNGYGGQGYGPSTQHMGYQSSAARGETDWSPSQRTQSGMGGMGGMGMDGRDGAFGRNETREQHVHRGTGPHRGKGPLGYQRSDERIREMVCEALADDDMIDASQIHVTVKDGEVTLSGTVDSRRIKREAEDCVSAVAGVRDVQIQLRVRDEQDRVMRSHSQGQGQQSATTGTTGSQSTAGHTGNGLANGMANGKTENKTETDDKKHRA